MNTKYSITLQSCSYYHLISLITTKTCRAGTNPQYEMLMSWFQVGMGRLVWVGGGWFERCLCTIANITGSSHNVHTASIMCLPQMIPDVSKQVSWFALATKMLQQCSKFDHLCAKPLVGLCQPDRQKTSIVYSVCLPNFWQV